MKKMLCLGAAVAASALLLSACVSTPSLSFSANWYRNTKNYGGLTGTSETLTYHVNFEPNDNAGRFTADYDTGKYVTTLRDVTVSAASPAEGVPAGFHGYLLHSEYSMTGRFLVNGVKGEEFTDSFVSDVWFLGTAEGLRPVYSSKRVASNIPLTNTSTGEADFSHYEYLYTASYDETLSHTTVTQKDLTKEGAEAVTFERKISGGGTFLDNEQILFAMRGLDMSASFQLRTLNPSSKAVTGVATTEVPSFETYRANFSMQTGTGEPVEAERDIEAARVTFQYTAANPGQSQTAVFARCTNPDENLYRSVMLYLEIDALYSLGTFRYSLASAVFNNK